MALVAHCRPAVNSIFAVLPHVANPHSAGYDSRMTTTIHVSDKGQVELPKSFRQRKKIKPGTPVRVTEVGEGLYITTIPEPTERELSEVIAAAGSLTRRQTEAEEKLVQDTIRAYRVERRAKGR